MSLSFISNVMKKLSLIGLQILIFSIISGLTIVKSPKGNKLYFSFNQVNAQNSWVWQNPSQTANSLYSITFTNENTGWSCGNEGTIIKTNDAGNFWQTQISGTSQDLRDIFFINSNYGWTVGYEGTILKTTNGGQNWVSKNYSEQLNLFSVSFVNESSGWVVGDSGVIIKTTSGGNSWTLQNSGTNNCLRSVQFLNSNIGFAAGQNGTILKTTNGGINWQILNSGFANDLTSVYFINSTTGWVSGHEGIFKTTNGGNTWTVQYPLLYTYFNELYFADANNGWVAGTGEGMIGSTGFIFHTTDGGNNWNLQETFNLGWFGYLNSVSFINSNTAYICGSFGYISKSTDGGNTWTEYQTMTNNTLHSIHFENDEKGWAVGNSGTILSTSDGGNNWIAQNFGTSTHLYSVTFTSQLTGFTVGSSGKIYKTTDGGESWSQQNSGTTNSLNSVCFVNSNIGWTVGTNGTILKTTDGGNTWINQSTGTTTNLYAVQFADELTGWATGGNYVFKTTDSGNTWTSYHFQFNLDAHSICFINENIGWIVGWYGDKIIKTTDGGNTWFQLPCVLPLNELESICFIDENNGWVVGDFGKIRRTSDGGNSWTQEPDFSNSTIFYSVWCNPDGKVWVAGTGGTIIYNSGAEYFEIGNGTSTNNYYTYPAPYGNYYKGARHQMLIKAEELSAAGAIAGEITALAFDVYSSNTCGPLEDFTIKYKQTTSNCVTGWDLNGMTTVYTASPNYLPDDGWNNHIFDNPVVWDGSSNILIETCFCSYWENFSENASHKYTVTPFNSVVCFKYDYDPNICSGTNPLFTEISANRPNMKLTIETFPQLNQPILTAPANNATGVITNPELQWNTVSDATSYRIQISSNSGFTSIIADQNNITTTSFSSPELSNNTTYFWRVNASADFYQSSEWSAIGSFTTQSILSQPVLVSPSDGTQNTSLTPTFSWQSVANAGFYSIVVSSTPTFSANIYISNSEVNGINYTSSNSLPENSIFYWKIKAHAEGYEDSEWSEVWSFTTLSPQFTEASVYPFSYSDYYFSEGGDYDNDNDLDFVLRNPFRIYKNNGNFSFLEQPQITGSYTSINNLEWIDYNNDGFLDVAASGEYSGLLYTKIYKNNGNNSFTEQTSITLAGAGYGDIAVADFNNDGWEDIITAGYVNNGETYSTHLYWNNGNNTFTEQSVSSFPNVIDCSISCADYDADGFIDFIINGFGSNNIGIYKNNGNETFTFQSSISLPSLMDCLVKFGDYNNDGFPDILMTGQNISNTRIYKNNGNNTFSELSNLNLPMTYATRSDWGDIDNDGDLDLILCGNNTPLEIYKNNGNDSFNLFEDADFPYSKFFCFVTAGDFDADHDIDLLISGSDNENSTLNKYFFENTINQANTVPTAPADLSAIMNGTSAIFSWSQATDAETPQDGLSYNIYVGTSSGNAQKKSPMSNISNGYRKIVKTGNAGERTTYTLNGLNPLTNYYWSVQSVDNNFEGSSFAQEECINCNSSDGVNIGSNTQSNSVTSYPSPYGNYYKGSRHQMLIKASEIAATGATAGYITALAFSIYSANNCGELGDFTIKYKLTSANAISGWDLSGLYTVFTSYPGYQPVTGWNTHIFDTPVYWDGISNILIETCFCSYWVNFTENASHYYTTTPFNSVVYYKYDYDQYICSSTPLFTEFSANRPNMRLIFSPLVQLPAPELDSPVDNANNITNSPLFMWNYVPNAFYSLQVSTNENFTAPIINLNNITNNVYSASGLLPNTTYFWRVKATGSGYLDSDWSEIRSFSTLSQLAQPILTSPANGASNLSFSQIFYWQQVANAGSYSIEVSSLQNFSGNLYISNSSVSGTSYNSGISLPGNTTFYWHVKAIGNNYQNSEWSETWSFTTQALPQLSQPNLTSPANGALNQPTTPAFSWQSVSNATSYTLQVSTNPSFTNNLYISTGSITNTSYTGTSLPNNTVYFWRVSASANNYTTSNWSTIRSFTIGTGPLAQPILQSPANNSVGVPLNQTFSWQAVPNAQTYSLEVSTSSMFSNYVINNTVYTNSFAATTQLQNNTTYYWRVRAFAPGYTNSVLSEIWHFTSVFGQLAQTNLATPANSTTNIDVYPVFNWQSVNNAQTYSLQVSANSNFSNLILNISGISGTSYTSITALQQLTQYFWRVCASATGYTTGNWSSTWSFTTLSLVNDNSCENAVNFGTINSVAVSWATTEPLDIAWYYVTLPQTYTNVYFSLCSSLYDTKLYVYDACNGNEIGYNDDYCGLQSSIHFDTLSAGTYYVKVAGYSSYYGNFTLSITGTMLTYCTNLYVNNCYYGSNLTYFNLGMISNYSMCNNSYNDYTYYSTNLTAGNSYQLSLIPGSNYQYASLWVDFNDDMIFSSEEILLQNVELEYSGVSYSPSINIPEDAQIGSHRLRIRTNVGSQCFDPCEMYNYGEAQDYTVYIEAQCYANAEFSITNIGNYTVNFQLSPEINSNNYYINWNFGDGFMQSGESNIMHTYSYSGTYYVFCYIYDLQNMNCNDSYYTEVIPTLTCQQGTITISGNVNNESCHISNDGEILLTIQGGISPYSFLWNNGSTAQNISGLPAGNYTVTVNDYFGCSAIASYVVSSPDILSVNAISTPINCFHGNAEITVTATGGTSPYSGTGTYTVQSGTYSYTVIDAHSCQSSATITVYEPELLVINTSFSEIECNGETTVVTVSASGAESPYSGTGNFTLAAGNHHFIVTSSNGCSASKSIEITEPEPLTSYISSTEILCAGETSTVTITASGGTEPYTGIGDFTETSGTYNYSVSDFNGCETIASISIAEPQQVTVEIVVSNATCDTCSDGNAEVTVSGGNSPYTILWSDGFSGLENQELLAGNYFVSIIDANNCTSISSFIVFGGESQQNLQLIQGWSFISTFIIPTNPSISDVFESVEADIAIIKDGNGQIYWPAFSVNQIGNMTIGNGYQIKMYSLQTLVISGNAVIPESCPIALPQGWSIIGYLRNSSNDVTQLMENIVSQLIIMKNGNGQIYWPAYNVNQIGNMNPGEGYQIKTSASCVLIYPSNNANICKSSINFNECQHFSNPEPSGNNMTLLIPNILLKNILLKDDEIAVMTESGKIVGTLVYNDENAAITIWGNEPSLYDFHGINKGEKFTLKIWKRETDNEFDLQIESWLTGSDVYDCNEISIADKIKQTSNAENVILYQNNPNPFTYKTEIRFYLSETDFAKIEVYNSLGELILVPVSGKFGKGTHTYLLQNKNLASGNYVIKLITSECVSVKTMTVN